MAQTIADMKIRLQRKGLAAVRALRELEQQKDELELKIKKQKSIIDAEIGFGLQLGDKIVGTDAKGHPLVSIKSSIVRSINTAMLRKENPELAEQCTTESERRRIYLAPIDPAQ